MRIRFPQPGASKEAHEQFLIGCAYCTGEQGRPKDYALAVECFRKAAALGDANAQYSLGSMYYGGLGVERDIEQATVWLGKAAGQGHAEAKRHLKEMRRAGREVVDGWLTAAAKGDATAQYNLGQMYEVGEGVAQSDKQAAAWYAKAAAQGHTDAQYDLGVMYQKGLGVAEDWARAAEWYRKAADQGHANAQYLLARLLEVGHGQSVAKNEAEAAEWYRRAVDQADDVRAMNNLGSMYATGRGVALDHTEAAALFRRAAEQGDHPSAQFNLGVALASGQGVAQDDAEALRWFGKAAAQGHAGAQAILKLERDAFGGPQEKEGQSTVVKPTSSTSTSTNEVARPWWVGIAPVVVLCLVVLWMLWG